MVLGGSPGIAALERLDLARTNVSPLPLPTRSLRTRWSRHVAALDHAPVVLEDGTVVVVSRDGEAIFLDDDGTDRGRLALGPGPTSAPTLLADGTLVVLDAAGDAVGARNNAVVFRTHVANVVGDGELGEPVRAQHAVGVPRGGYPLRRRISQVLAPDPSAQARAWLLPLDDGGAVTAVGRELACLDAEGGIRSRAVAPSSVASPLLAAGRSVVFVSDEGQVYAWDFRGTPDAVQAHGTFGGGFEGAVAVADAHHLVAVVDGTRLVALDLTTGETTTRARSARGGGTFTGAFALESTTGGTALLEEMTLLGTRILAVDVDGQEAPFAALLTSQSALPSVDAGGGALTPTHSALFADRAGRVAYATVDGHVGVASPTSKVELGTLPCGTPATGDLPRGRSRVSAGFAGLVPAGPGRFVIACENGSVALIEGDPSLE